MNYLSVCSGIEAATVAWKPLGWKAVAFSEIEKFPRAVLKHLYPETPLHGDFTTIGENDYGSIDLLVGGTPCQSFSIAGLRGGLDDDRGNLALEFLKLAQRKRPKWIVWENVPGVFSSLSHDAPDARPPDIDLDGDNVPEDGEEVVVEDEYDSIENHAFSCFLAGLSELGYGLSYRVLDAQYFGVAQRRRRVFVIGYLGDWRPAKAVLFEPESMRGDSPPSRKTGKNITPRSGPRIASGKPTAGTLMANAGTKLWLGNQEALTGDYHIIHGNRAGPGIENFVTEEVSPTVTSGPPFSRTGNDRVECEALVTAIPINTQIALRHKALGRSTGFGVGDDGDPGYTLQAGHSHAVAFSAKDHGADKSHANSGNWMAVQQAMAVRRLTPIECERLQGFPDNYTKIPWRNKDATECPDGPRYKALGNSMAVPVMRWLGERIEKVNDILEAEKQQQNTGENR